MNYFDASALVKRFVTEQGSPLVQHLVTRDRAATGKVAHTEVHAALARKRREGFVSLRDYSLACRQFDRDWRSYVLVELHDEILTIARGWSDGTRFVGLTRSTSHPPSASRAVLTRGSRSSQLMSACSERQKRSTFKPSTSSTNARSDRRACLSSPTSRPLSVSFGAGSSAGESTLSASCRPRPSARRRLRRSPGACAAGGSVPSAAAASTCSSIWTGV